MVRNDVRKMPEAIQTGYKKYILRRIMENFEDIALHYFLSLIKKKHQFF